LILDVGEPHESHAHNVIPLKNVQGYKEIPIASEHFIAYDLEIKIG